MWRSMAPTMPSYHRTTLRDFASVQRSQEGVTQGHLTSSLISKRVLPVHHMCCQWLLGLTDRVVTLLARTLTGQCSKRMATRELCDIQVDLLMHEESDDRDQSLRRCPGCPPGGGASWGGRVLRRQLRAALSHLQDPSPPPRNRSGRSNHRQAKDTRPQLSLNSVSSQSRNKF